MRGERRRYARKHFILTLGLIGFFMWTATPVDAASLADANNDGVVDGSDLLSWQAHLYMQGPNMPGDFNHDSIVNGQDLLMWQSQLYMTAPAPAPQANNAVPEPVTFATSLIAMGSICLAIRRRAT